MAGVSVFPRTRGGTGSGGDFSSFLWRQAGADPRPFPLNISLCSLLFSEREGRLPVLNVRGTGSVEAGGGEGDKCRRPLTRNGCQTPPCLSWASAATTSCAARPGGGGRDMCRCGVKVSSLLMKKEKGRPCELHTNTSLGGVVSWNVGMFPSSSVRPLTPSPPCSDRSPAPTLLRNGSSPLNESRWAAGLRAWLPGLWCWRRRPDTLSRLGCPISSIQCRHDRGESRSMGRKDRSSHFVNWWPGTDSQ